MNNTASHMMALESLAPGAEWAVYGGEIRWEEKLDTDNNPTGEYIATNLTWISTNSVQPTREQILNETARLQAELDSKEYQRLRQPEYPSIGDQLDALWKGGDAAADMLARVQAIKSKYPKE